jgi:glucokinase
MRYLVLDIGGTAIKSALSTPAGELSDFRETPSDGRQGGAALLKRVFDLIASYRDYDRIGVSTAGQVDSKHGRIVFANDNIPNYTGTELGPLLARQFSVPVEVENDVNAAALGEAFLGSAQGYPDFLCLTFGTGIGGAIIANGNLYRGFSGLAGEFGHMVTHAAGRPCTCGQRGCYEQYASTTALVRAAVQVNASWTSGRQITAARDAGEAGIIEVLDSWTAEAAIGLASLIHIFNPPLLVLGGGILADHDIFLRIRQQTLQRTMPASQNVEIRPAKLGNQAGLLGMTFICANRDNPGGIHHGQQ